jgi:hypothetical protein
LRRSLLLLSISSLFAQAVRLYPVDDTGRDPSFRGYVRKLGSAVEAHDTKQLQKLVGRDVFVGPESEDKGWEKFVATWRPDAGDTDLWSALSDLMSLGFIRQNPGLYLSPYLVWRFPRELVRGAYLVVVRDEVPLRQSPSLKAPAVETLSFDVVRPLGSPLNGDDLNRWIHVQALDGKSGYLMTHDVMSPLMARAQFARRGGHWLMTALERGR